MVLRAIDAVKKYKYLFSQLVARDFKTKYKRSIFGILWSVLNPLLTMIVQYIVFSNLFRYDMEHYVIYLFVGIVFFSFFSDATNQAMASIVQNGNLITKVYVPKYIFPVSKVVSSSINFVISLIILFVAMGIDKVTFSPVLILLVIPFICILFFSIGIGFILSAMMVYFRDTQFLYNVLITIWMYLTPIFYPESILADEYVIFLKMNPLYYIINYARTLILQSTVPDMNALISCIGVSIVAFFIGAFVFKKAQNNFVINL
jgi:ABC-2 type transport system permease protein